MRLRLEILQNSILEGPETRYSGQSEKWLASNENEVFWQWFWARIQKCFKTASWRVLIQIFGSLPKNGSRAMKMSRSGNGFWPGARNASKLRLVEGPETALSACEPAIEIRETAVFYEVVLTAIIKTIMVF